MQLSSSAGGGAERRVTYMERFFGIGPLNPDTGKPSSRLIYPLSRFGVMWIGVTALLLGYTGRGQSQRHTRTGDTHTHRRHRD